MKHMSVHDRERSILKKSRNCGEPRDAARDFDSTVTVSRDFLCIGLCHLTVSLLYIA